MREPASVSSDAEELILVSPDDRDLGSSTKAACHDGAGVLHRAFSLFVFDDRGRLLLQQRSQKKRLWGGYWSNSCCSHPRRGETMEHATVRRLEQELGVTSELSFLFKFEYRAAFGNVGAEHELCHVFAGRARGEPRPHPDEIAAVMWLSPEQVTAALDSNPERYTPWFKLEWERILRDHLSALPARATALR